uniref:Thioredoxin-like protein n=1 Tax=Inonotus obliquus TaxID=167356 RepID=A0A097JTQ9_9AGAM|nr:thioredoxin-like protein [Inonotus obliquus]
MSGLRFVPQLTNLSFLVSRSTRLGNPVNVSLRRGFSSTTCRKEQFFDADQETFKRAISKENSKGKVVLVDFYADWCGPCKMLSPILAKLTATENTESVKTGSGRSLDLVTIDTEEQGELAMKYEVRALPTVIAFKDGKPVEKFVGALAEKVNWL